MPHDLMRYRAEIQNIPSSVQEAWFKKYDKFTVHLMPIIRSSYYIKYMPVFEENSNSDSSFRDNTDDEKNKKDSVSMRRANSKGIPNDMNNTAKIDLPTDVQANIDKFKNENSRTLGQ